MYPMTISTYFSRRVFFQLFEHVINLVINNVMRKYIFFSNRETRWTLTLPGFKLITFVYKGLVVPLDCYGSPRKPFIYFEILIVGIFQFEF